MTLIELAESLLKDPEQTASESVLRELVQLALVARRAGVAPTLADLTSPTEREAWVRAGEELEVERARRIGLAVQGELGLAASSSDLDGGVEVVSVVTQKVCAAVAARERGR